MKRHQVSSIFLFLVQFYFLSVYALEKRMANNSKYYVDEKCVNNMLSKLTVIVDDNHSCDDECRTTYNVLKVICSPSYESKYRFCKYVSYGCSNSINGFDSRSLHNLCSLELYNVRNKCNVRNVSPNQNSKVCGHKSTIPNNLKYECKCPWDQIKKFIEENKMYKDEYKHCDKIICNEVGLTCY